MNFAGVYPHYIAKAEKRGRSPDFTEKSLGNQEGKVEQLDGLLPAMKEK